ncbi:CLUMA_CG008283, isoform A [Clunio marinus]|uniref:CLUMA_CG008283, isoform A n=1 Tax=Clunio marinus TaxID=568069 RepID=A0A1J1I3B5_9DIPT|nr:CLUMA_CG008283, isoform A [Clunio marinus]
MAMKVSPDLNINMTNILKIENFINDQSYSELIEYSANFNSRLCIERRLRMPFLDPQTGVAQKHSNLYFKKSQRLPGLKEGQIYTYPSTRWRCKTTSMKFNNRPFYRFRAADNCTTLNSSNNTVYTTATSTISTSNVNGTDGDVSDFQALIDAESNSFGAGDTDSKDSQNLKDETMTKDWFFEDMDAHDMGSEEQNDSDFDYNINGYKRKKKPVTTRKSSRKPKDPEMVKKSRSGGSSNRNRKSSSRKGNRADGSLTSFDVEPPSFDSVQGDLMDGSSVGAYRSF